jgi:hypothetical protein
VHTAIGISKNTIRKVIEESNESLPGGETDGNMIAARIRAIGGSRKQLIVSDPSLLADLYVIIDPIIP